MPNEKKGKKKYTAAQKAAYKEKQKLNKLQAKLAGAHIIKAARGSGGFTGPITSFKGRGDYRQDLIEGGAKLAGRGIGKAWDWISGKANKWFGKYFGNGDYRTSGVKIKRNSLWNRTVVPNMISSDHREFTIRRRVCIGSVQSSAAFQIQKFILNPGLIASFPWVSALAVNFQEWELSGMICEFVPTVSPNSGGNANGTVAMCCQYNVLNPDPANLLDVQNTEQSVSGRPIDMLMEPVECDHAFKPVNCLQIRPAGGALPSGATAQMYDHANLYVVNQGQQDSSIQIGQIWVSYDLTLMMPITNDSNNDSVPVDHWKGVNPTTVLNLGASGSMDPGSTLGGSVSAAASRYTFPSYVTSGQWLVVFFSSTNMTSNSLAAVITPTNCTRTQLWVENTGFDSNIVAYAPVTGIVGAGGRVMCACVLKVTAPGASFILQAMAIAGTGFCDLTVSPWNGNLVTLSAARGSWLRARRDASEFQKAIEEKEDRTNELVTALEARLSRLASYVEEKEFDRTSQRVFPQPALRSATEAVRLSEADQAYADRAGFHLNSMSEVPNDPTRSRSQPPGLR